MEEGGYSFILFLSFIQVNVLQPEFPFQPNPKARGRQTTWLYRGNTLEVLIITSVQRGRSFRYTEFREIETMHVMLTPQLLRFSKYSLSLLKEIVFSFTQSWYLKVYLSINFNSRRSICI
jgi:hypothetical protein